MSRIVKEKQSVTQMIKLYCNKKHQTLGLCEECEELNQYSLSRLDSCPYGDNKSFCSKCSTHCYAKKQRAQIKEVMRFSGPHMIYHNPKLAFQYLIQRLKK